MASVAVTNTFSNGTTADGSQVNTNFSDLVTYVNNRNAASATWDAVWITNASTVPVVANNSSGTQNIANFQDNGTNVLTVADGGVVTVTANGGSGVALTANNGTSTGAALSCKDNGTVIFQVNDGGTVNIGNVTPDTLLHIYGGSAGTVDAAGNTLLTIEDDGATGMSFLGPNTVIQSIYFGDADDNDVGSIRYNHSGNSLTFAQGGSDNFSMSATQFVPGSDNAIKCGASGSRFSEIWAGNGTIQTSMLSQKKDVVDIEDTVQVPRGIKFKFNGSEDEVIGFVGDDLPEEGRPLLSDGTRSNTDVYTSAVIGILCSKLRTMEVRVVALEKK